MATKKRRDESGEKQSWQVTIPITGIAYATVEASSEEEAIAAAMDTQLEIEAWEAIDEICRGHVFRGMQNRAEATPEG